MRPCSETCWWVIDQFCRISPQDRCGGVPMSVSLDVGVVEGSEGMQQPAVATPAAGAQWGSGRGHAQAAAAIAAHEADQPQSPEEPDVQRHCHQHD
jgi:hypothetical protein